MESKESIVKVACCQIEPKICLKDENLKKTLDYICEAAGEGAGLILLPELVNTGYVFNSRREAYEMAEKIPEGDTTQAWIECAEKHGIYLAAGIAERDGDRLYNSSVFVGPEGFLGNYRKLHLWNREKLFFEPGDLGLPVYNTPLGRLGMYICYDMWFPEMTRIYAMQGVDLILNVTNWVASDKPSEDGRLTEAVCVANAYMNAVFIAAADRIGVERGQPFLGMSMIVSPSGELSGGPASYDGEEIVYAECNLSEARLRKRKTRLNHIILDRRTDVYDALLGYGEIPFNW
ncbi:MAG: nitrilase family protein [Candidatus Bathyarchaeia archaeon]